MTSTAARATERELRVFSRTWRGAAFTTFVAPVLLLVAMGVGLGELVDDDTASLEGLDYLVFVTPGILVGSAAQTGAGYSLWPIMAGHKWLGFHRAMVASPLSPTDVLSGHLLWVAARTMVAATVVVTTGAIMGGVVSWWAVAAIPIAALVSTSFAAPIAAYSARCDSDASFDPLLRIGVTPLYLFSGTFFPATELPMALQWVAKAFPLWHGAELARAATSGTGSAPTASVHLAVLGAYIVAGWVWGRSTFTARLTP